jgi:hypothetical protein
MVQLLRQLEQKGLSRTRAIRLVLAMADRRKLIDWLVQDLEKAPPEVREAFVQKVLAWGDVDPDLEDHDDDETQSD